MFKPCYEVYFQGIARESENLFSGTLFFTELSAVIEFVDLANEFYDFETFEIYRVFEPVSDNGGCCSCRVENM